MSTKKKIIIVVVAVAICFIGYKLVKQISKPIDKIEIDPQTGEEVITPEMIAASRARKAEILNTQK